MKLGENIQIGKMKVIEGKNLGKYVHSNGKIGVVVSMSGGSPELARDIAMHVAATSPHVISPEEVSQELVDKEKEIWADQLKQEGKPEDIIDKIMMGKENLPLELDHSCSASMFQKADSKAQRRMTSL